MKNSRRRRLCAVIFFSLCTIALSFPLPKLTATSFGFIESDVPYSPAHRNALDLYIPHTLDFSTVVYPDQPMEGGAVSSSGRYPVVLFIHGGSFVAGDKSDYPYAQIGETFQKLGIVCAVMSYRLLQDSVWPAQPKDVAKAVRWLKNNIETYGGDPGRIFLVGHSAGGHLAALLAADASYLSTEGLALHDIAGAVSIGAMMSDAGSLQRLSEREETELFRNDWFFKIFGSKQNFLNSLPASHINPSMPPILLMLADAELHDPPKERTVIEFAAKAEKAGVPVRYSVLAGRTHMGTVEQMVNQDDPAILEILSFIAQR